MFFNSLFRFLDPTQTILDQTKSLTRLKALDNLQIQIIRIQLNTIQETALKLKVLW